MNKKIIASLLCVISLSGCVTVPPPNLFVTSPEILQQRQMETRRYDGIEESKLIAACANVLQDMGYNLENSETKLGVLTASKQRDATNGGEIVAAVVVAIVFGVSTPVSKDQTIRVALAIRPVTDGEGGVVKDSHFVRVTFQRIVRRTDNSVITETLKDPILYQEFYSNVSKSVFLEAQSL